MMAEAEGNRRVTKCNQMKKTRDGGMIVLAFRPRLLYCPLYFWNTVTGGKFIAPLLQHLSGNFSDSLIGITLAIQYAIVACLAGLGGSFADTVERKSQSWGWGRLQVLSVAVTLGTLAFMGHILPQCFGYNSQQMQSEEIPKDNNMLISNIELSWHLLMRCIYAVALAIGIPSIDGLALAHLDAIEGASQSDFGKERLFGAVWWGVGSLLTGVGVDRYGFDFMYAMAILSTLATYIAICLYAWGLNRDTTGVFEENRRGALNEEVIPKHTPCHNQQLPINSISERMPEREGDKLPTKQLLSILCRGRNGVPLLLFVFLLALGLSVVDNLAFMFFAFLGSSNTMNGYTVVFSIIMEIPCFYLAPNLLTRLGPSKMLLVAGTAFVVRVIGYAIVPKGCMSIVLALEILHGITYACQKVGSVEFVAQNIPKGYEASGQGILIFISYLGLVFGLSIGGLIQETLGPRVMYGIIGSVVFVGMIVLLVAEMSLNDTESNALKEVKLDGEKTHLLEKTISCNVNVPSL